MKEQGESILAGNVPASMGELRGKFFLLVMFRPVTCRTMGSRSMGSVSKSLWHLIQTTPPELAKFIICNEAVRGD